MLTFHQIGASQIASVKQASRASIIAVLDELAKKPDITINQNCIAELDKTNGWPVGFGEFGNNVVGPIIHYKGKPVFIALASTGYYFKLFFPSQLRKKMSHWISQYDAPREWTVQILESDVFTGVERGTNTDDLYDGLVAAHKRYLSKEKSIAKHNTKIEADANKTGQAVTERGERVRWMRG